MTTITPPVYLPEDEVLIGDDIPARVTQACLLTGFRWHYCCEWWDDRQLRSCWLYDWQIKPKGKRAPIGFESVEPSAEMQEKAAEAMRRWIKDGKVTTEYLREVLGDPMGGVTIGGTGG